MTDEKLRYGFGENWASFVKGHFSEERAQIARKCLLSILELPDLKGKTFLDIGCGSGLSSLAAHDADAERIVSFDLDTNSVKTTQALHQLRGAPEHWQVMQGSVLDEAFLSQLEPADIAYSWGVLHHTGQMWQAVENAARLMKPDGVFFIALYTTTHLSDYWMQVKRRYNTGGPLGKWAMETRYVSRYIAGLLLQRKNPFRYMREYKRNRGMSFMVNVRDWLGGYPYEDAKIEQVLRFGRDNLGMELVNLKTGEACTEYVFAHPNLNKQWRR